jgi:hypothetical protein
VPHRRLVEFLFRRELKRAMRWSLEDRATAEEGHVLSVEADLEDLLEIVQNDARACTTSERATEREEKGERPRTTARLMARGITQLEAPQSPR